ncbi:MAG: arsinothricin resistance N-acetyltransferase ArsN1 family B [Acidobacteriota bacterium]
MQQADNPLVRVVRTQDAGTLAEIYNYYITQTVVTFEEDPVTASEIAHRIQQVHTASLPWLVAEISGRPVGYAYATKWRVRPAYRFSTEVTVYVAPHHDRRGIGSALYAELLATLRDSRVHAAMGGIALPNEASIALHEKFGFAKVAHFNQVGFKFNRWIDVGYWELLL